MWCVTVGQGIIVFDSDLGKLQESRKKDAVSEGGSGAQGVGNPVAVDKRGNTGRTVPDTF